jgi:tripartite-type tricarboxylate transporter receptor subunit TctC
MKEAASSALRGARLRAAVATLALACMPAVGIAQSFPAKPVRLIVPTPAGGAVDLIARLAGQKMSESTGQPAIVENRPNGVAAAESVARSAPDGYTVLVANTTTHVSNLFLLRSLPYDPLRDFTPVAGVVDALAVLVTHPSVPGTTVRELLDHARAQPGKLTYGSSGAGSAFHLSGEVLKSLAGVHLVHVPYKGLAPALSDVVGGQISLAFTALSVAMPQVKSGKLKLLAIVDDKRYAGLPNVPALAETVPGFQKPATWTGFAGPAGLPLPVVSRLNSEINRALQSPDVRAKLEAVGLDLALGTPEQFAALIRRDIDSYGRIVKAIGLTPE